MKMRSIICKQAIIPMSISKGGVRGRGRLRQGVEFEGSSEGKRGKKATVVISQ